uniref:Thiamin ABC transporter, substrate-binding component n=1 Tax=uncultured bacterium contig00064 TaxID=1181547 RepID=A0A806KDL2_9BACT|nr:thiamin ABC transporter, substrate-binding component [uncultured bacterium contig00064]
MKITKTKLILLFILAALSVFVSCKKGSGNEVVIWTYDSFNSEWGPGPDVSRVFEEKTGIKIVWVSQNDAGSLASRLLLEGENAGADIVLGLDQNLAGRVLDSGLLEEYRPLGSQKIFPELVLDPSFRLIPMDYSYFAIVYDSEKISAPPGRLEDLANPRFSGNLILIDPRTSSPGLGFFAWVKEVYGAAWPDYWQRLSPSILTIAEGWSSAYGLFTREEAPMVLSYTTSPGYHLEYEDTERYKAAIFSDGHPLQIEAAGLLRAAPNKENAKIFLDFMLSPDFQSIIPLTNWMYPVIDIPLPASFRVNPKSGKPLMPGTVTEAELNEWASLMIRIR